MSVEETWDDLKHGNILHALERIGDGIKTLAASTPPWLKKALGFTIDFAVKVGGDLLQGALEAGYNAAEASDKKKLDKLPVAVNAAKDYLGDHYKDEMLGELTTSMQNYWASKQ